MHIVLSGGCIKPLGLQNLLKSKLPICSVGSISATALAISVSLGVLSMIFSRKSMFCCILSSGTLKSSMDRFALAWRAILIDKVKVLQQVLPKHWHPFIHIEIWQHLRLRQEEMLVIMQNKMCVQVILAILQTNP